MIQKNITNPDLYDDKRYKIRQLVLLYNKKIQKATIKDWSKEYLSSIVSVKSVKNIDEAIHHINKYGTKHTDAIICRNKRTSEIFLKNVILNHYLHSLIRNCHGMIY